MNLIFAVLDGQYVAPQFRTAHDGETIGSVDSAKVK
jgi:hypothetical protein